MKVAFSESYSDELGRIIDEVNKISSFKLDVNNVVMSPGGAPGRKCCILGVDSLESGQSGTYKLVVLLGKDITTDEITMAFTFSIIDMLCNAGMIQMSMTDALVTVSINAVAGEFNRQFEGRSLESFTEPEEIALRNAASDGNVVAQSILRRLQ